MRSIRLAAAAMMALSVVFCASGALPAVAGQVTIPGERLDPSAYGPSWIESMEAAIERNRTAVPPPNEKDRNGRPGVWVIPSRNATTFPHSGDHNAVNKWGDTRMGIGFPGPVDVQGAWFAGQAGEGVWTPGIRVVGYRNGAIVGETDQFSNIGAEPAWMEMNLRGVDRIEIIALPAFRGGGWYGMDDLTYRPAAPDGGRIAPRPIVVDFDDLPYRTKLTGSGYAGLTWETGTGDFLMTEEGVHGPLVPPGVKRKELHVGGPAPSRGLGTLPTLYDTFQGVLRGDAGSWSYPPDTDGAIGPDHYVETVNRNFAVYDKYTGEELINILLGSFLPGSNGDPRCVFDHHSGRWIVHVCDFSATETIYLAVSLTDDPTGDWFKTSFQTDQGADAGRWPDYPTLGVDENGLYIAAYMVGGPGMSIFALDKAPLVGDPPELGTITAWRNLPWEGAIQPAHTYGSPGGEYLISINSSSSLRVRRINPPLTEPTLTDLGTVSVSYFSDPPNAPALGSSTPLNTVDDRLMMSVYRDGSLWAAHTINVNGRCGCRWYEIDPEATTVIQEGTVADSSLYYFFPSIMVNQAGDAVMGFTGSNASQYAACYYTGRLATDPPGEMAPPEMFKEGTGPQNNVDAYGRNRWGDYSYTTLDPLDQTTFWTIQEYGHGTDVWGTYLAILGFGAPDCNENGIPDNCDIDCGPPGGECDIPGCGESEDCNANGVPDECELQGNDCNENGVPDECDIADGTSEDCNENGVPDECDIADGTSEDCQPNGIPDECEVGLGEVVLASFDFASDPGWSTQGLWAFGQPTGGGGEYGGPDPTGGHTGSYVYGYNLNGDYENNLPERHLTSEAIDCSDAQEVHLSFWRWLGVEQPAYDHAYVRVSNDGANWITVWENAQEITDTAWVQVDLDLSSVADGEEIVYLRWTMGPTDSGWRYCGWNIDDVEVRGLSYVESENDCQPNGVPDECDIADGTSEDSNGNGMPDECECPGDLDGNGVVNTADLLYLLAAWGDNPEGDVDGDGDTDTADLLILLAAWGECP
jgi:hypothetical protein